MTTSARHLIILCLLTNLCWACSKRKPSAAPVIAPEDSLTFLSSRGISTMVSDSGVLRYKIVAEQWDILNTRPDTWKFIKGLLMLRYDRQAHVDLYVQADTAYFHEQKTWELRGRVDIRNIQGTVFRTEEFFWDMQSHEMWSDQFMRITTPDRELQGTTFRSNEQMTDYFVSNSAGTVPVKDVDKQKEEEKEEEKPDSTQQAEQAPAEQPQETNKAPKARKATQQQPQQGHFK